MRFWRDMQDLWEISTFELNNFLETDWDVVQFKRWDFIYLAAAILGAAFLLKLGIKFLRKKRREGYYEDSGVALNTSVQPGLIAKLLGFSFKIILIFGTAAVLTALTDPFTTQTDYIQIQECRELIYLKDASTSMGWRFKSYNQSRAEIVQDFQLNLIAKRWGKCDRAAFFLFETRATQWADFTRDADSLMYSVDNAPLVIADAGAEFRWSGRFILKNYRKESNSGATNLHLGLAAVIKAFELKGSKEAQDRSVIIITDGAAEQDPEPQLSQLKKMNIIPHLVFIDPDTELEAQFHGEGSDKLKLPAKLLKDVRKYGGDYFIATDKNSLEKISEKLDQLHAAKFSARQYSKENFIYRRFLVVAIWLMALAGLVRLLTWPYQRVT